MEETLRTFHNVLSLAGISFFSKTNPTSKKSLLFLTYNLLLGFFAVIFLSGFVINNFSNPPLFIQGACSWTTAVIMYQSMGHCLLFRNKFRMFLNEMAFRDCVVDMPLIKHALQNDNTGKLKDLKDLVINSQMNLFRFIRILLKNYVAFVVLNVTLYACSPIYRMIVLNDKSLRLLTSDMWFPWSLKNFKVYVASYIFQIYIGYLYYTIWAGLQSTMLLLVGQTMRHLKIVTFVLQNLNELSDQLVGDDKENWQYCCTEILSQCIKHYTKIKRLSNRLNVICQPLYLVLLLLGTVLVCTCSVKIAVVKQISLETMKYVIHEIIIVLIVLMFCSMGQQVENECEKLQLAITEKWYLYDKNHKSNVLIFNMAVSQGMPIYIFGSITLSSATFTWFIKTMMSFFTLAMSVLEG